MNKLNLFIRNSVIQFLKIIHKENDEKVIDSLVQFIKFCLVGLTNTILSYLINIAILKLLQPFRLSWDYIFANLIAFFISVAWSFYWNNKYVFTQEEGGTRIVWKALLKTYLSYAFTGILLTNVLSYILIDKLGISKYVAPLINLVISIPLNFVINKLWAFKSEPDDAARED